MTSIHMFRNSQLTHTSIFSLFDVTENRTFHTTPAKLNTETTETTVRQWIASIRGGAGSGGSSSLVEATPPSPKQYWNQGISKLQDVINQPSSSK